MPILILFLAMLMSGGLLIIDRTATFIVAILLFLLFNMSARFSLRKILVITTWILFIFSFHFLAHGLSAEQFLNRISLVIVGLMLVFLYGGKDESAFKADFLLIGYLFAVQALLTSILANSFPAIFSLVAGENYQIMTLLGIFNYHELIDSATFKRPDGFFWEPGVLQFYLNLALYYSIILRKPLSMKMLLVSSVLVTASTTGLIILSLILIRFSYAPILKAFIGRNSLTPILLLIPLVGFFPIFAESIQDKFIGEASGSWLARQHDTVLGIQLVIQHPWLGIGVDVDKYLMMTTGVFGSIFDFSSFAYFEDRQPTNSIVQMFYGFGIPIAVAWLFLLYNNRYVNRSLTHMGIIVLTLSAELLALTPIFLFFIMSQDARQKRE